MTYPSQVKAHLYDDADISFRSEQSQENATDRFADVSHLKKSANSQNVISRDQQSRTVVVHHRGSPWPSLVAGTALSSGFLDRRDHDM